MSILTYTDLIERICSDSRKLTADKIYINPCDIEKCITPMSYDLRVGELYRKYSSDRDENERLNPGEAIVLEPGDTVLVTTREAVGMPKDGSVSALIVSKASVVAKGFSGISTKVDPGWNGPLRITVHNLSKSRLTLPFDELFCTIIFFRNNTNETKLQYMKRDLNPLALPYHQEKQNWLFERWHHFLVLIIPSITYLITNNYFPTNLAPLLTASMALSIFAAQTIEKSKKDRPKHNKQLKAGDNKQLKAGQKDEE